MKEITALDPGNGRIYQIAHLSVGLDIPTVCTSSHVQTDFTYSLISTILFIQELHSIKHAIRYPSVKSSGFYLFSISLQLTFCSCLWMAQGE